MCCRTRPSRRRASSRHRQVLSATPPEAQAGAARAACRRASAAPLPRPHADLRAAPGTVMLLATGQRHGNEMSDQSAPASSHAHGHDHHHHRGAPADFGRAFAWGIALNLGFIAVEIGFGLIGHSVALLADAGHNLSDVLGLAIAWTASMLAQRQPTHRYTYGLRSTSILAALFNAIVLFVAIGGIIVEAINRFAAPQPVASGLVMVVAGIGILVNGATALLFLSGQRHDLNIRGAFLHMAADAAVSLGVVIA